MILLLACITTFWHPATQVGSRIGRQVSEILEKKIDAVLEMETLLFSSLSAEIRIGSQAQGIRRKVNDTVVKEELLDSRCGPIGSKLAKKQIHNIDEV